MREIKINRFTAWILLFSILLYFISGYGMTKEIIDFKFSQLLHRTILPIIAFTAFTIHASLSIKISFMRWRIWNSISKYLLFSFFTVIYLLFLYIAFSYQKPITNPNLNTIQKESSLTNNQEQKIFSSSGLTQYNGKNGNPAYVAVDGIVYDLSSVFIDGTHKGYPAGQDLTNAFYTHHEKSEITKYPAVGILK
jgi:predicted heme/steroid binding protein